MSDFITVSSFSFSELEDQLNEARAKVRAPQAPRLTPPPPLSVFTGPTTSGPEGTHPEAQSFEEKGFPHSYKKSDSNAVATFTVH